MCANTRSGSEKATHPEILADLELDRWEQMQDLELDLWVPMPDLDLKRQQIRGFWRIWNRKFGTSGQDLCPRSTNLDLYQCLQTCDTNTKKSQSVYQSKRKKESWVKSQSVLQKKSYKTPAPEVASAFAGRWHPLPAYFLPSFSGHLEYGIIQENGNVENKNCTEWPGTKMTKSSAISPIIWKSRLKIHF